MQAAKLVATVVGQDLEQRDDGMFRIARRVAKDRVISTVDPEARHGHKTAARGFDGYKAHIAIDPDSEIITATTVTAGNVGDGSVADVLVADVLAETPAASPDASVATDVAAAGVVTADVVAADIAAIPTASADASVADAVVADVPAAPAAASPDVIVVGAVVADVLAETDIAAPLSGPESESARATPSGEPQIAVRPAEAVAPVEIYGDASYGTAQFVEMIERAGAEANVKVQPPAAPEGKFAKDAFEIDLTNNTVRCPAGVLVVIRPSTASSEGVRLANFGVRCNSCELRSRCTDGKDGRTIRVHPQEATLQRSRIRQRHPSWKARYRSTRPKVERKIAHLMQRRHGGRRARVRGRARVADDFALLGAAHNLRRMATLGVHYNGSAWRR
jgi:hypothetical protein